MPSKLWGRPIDPSQYVTEPAEPAPEPSARERALRTLLEGSFSVAMNMSDTFGFACADSEDFDLEDLEAMAPIIVEYGHHALTAYAAVKRGAEPISCRCHHDGQPYKDARAKIEKLRNDGRLNFGD